MRMSTVFSLTQHYNESLRQCTKYMEEIKYIRIEEKEVIT